MSKHSQPYPLRSILCYFFFFILFFFLQLPEDFFAVLINHPYQKINTREFDS